MSGGDRLQKVLARAGVASRRHAEELITAGRVRVNGRLVHELGTRVDPRKDKVEVDGRRVLAEPLVYYMFHKPRGTVSTLNDPEGRATIAEYLKDLPARIYPVGRLDFHTSGALLLTNDGELAQALLHPRRAVSKTYVAKVRGVPTDIQLDPWREGMEIEAVADEVGRVRLQPVDVEVLRHAPSGIDATRDNGTTWMKITLREGRNRQIHRMAEAVGLFVMRLARIAFAGLTTEGLRPGELRPLTDKEVTLLRSTFLRAAENAKRRDTGAEPADPRGTRAAGPARERYGEARNARRGTGVPNADVGERAESARAPRGPRAAGRRDGARSGAGRDAGAPAGGEAGRGRAPRAGGSERSARGATVQREERGARGATTQREERGGRGATTQREERGARGPARSDASERGPRGVRAPVRGERAASSTTRESARDAARRPAKNRR